MPSLLDLRREAQWRRWSKNPYTFAGEAWHIKHPAHGRIKLNLFPGQIKALEHWQENRYSLTLKARQVGYSTVLAFWFFWLAFFHSDREMIMISRTEREAIDLLRKSKYGYDNLADWIKRRGPQPTVDHQQKMQFDNGSQIISMPSASDPARGSTAYAVGVDEWAFLPNAEDAWASIEPVADVGGRVIGLSTANGSGNWFHETWVGAETGDNLFKPLFQSWRANGDRDDDWYAAKKAAMLPWQLAQEYPNNPEEAFIKSGNPVFDLDVLERLKLQLAEPVTGWLVA